ncbi:hypothetical protein Ppa06_20990 [Planomonospora parontospora subsp. parontospora]|uniref:Uncharacterized protein n=2 Tax=Planomonospora parontospora TaxID=58119 RepID=A0AA37F412_9ACTN|nr:hypothetical protein GCM10010126_22560 [Planomonospora parontospora]GII08301.1 hypothetical protein Ppa06_20990 [Planomonospora parontospora subsp. parontospora]
MALPIHEGSTGRARGLPKRMNGALLVGLNEIERQILLRELAEIATELAELQRRALVITARVDRDESGRLAHPA